jgi:hypothetical protein
VLTPRPLLVNALHNKHLLALPYRSWSAWIQASRAVTTGRQLEEVKKRRGRRQSTGGVARLQRKRVEEEVGVDDVAFTAIGVGERRRGEAVLADEGSVDVVENVSPDLTDTYR